MTSPTDPTAAVLDASAAVALCSREPSRDAVVRNYVAEAGVAGRKVYAPGAITGEALHVLCKKLARGELGPAAHALAVADLEGLARNLLPPPGGEHSLIAPAVRLSAGYTCDKSNDSLYLALAEDLAGRGEVVEVVTFDDDQARRAGRLTGVTGRRLPDS